MAVSDTVAIGFGVSATTPLLWLFMISETFSRPTGLFISHFGWDKDAVKRAMRYYRMAIFVIVPLVILLLPLNIIVIGNLRQVLVFLLHLFVYRIKPNY